MSYYSTLLMSLNPIAYWRKPTPTVWPDASGHGYDAVMIAGPTVVAGPPGGGADGAVLLDGSTQYGQGPLVPQGNYFSLIGWIQGELLADNQRIASNRDDGATGGFDWLLGGTSGAEVYTPGGNWLRYGTYLGSLADGLWHMIAYTTAADAAKMYIDGALCGQVAAANTGVATCGLNLGAMTPLAGASNKLEGSLAQFSILPPLSAGQIAALYTAGINTPPKQAGGGWRAWWAVDE